MLKTAIGFALGVLLFQQLQQIPPIWVLVPPCLLLVLWYKRRFWQIVFAFVLGFVWSHAYAWITEPAWLPDGLPKSDILATGSIQGIPQVSEGQSRFIFQVHLLEAGEHRYRGNWRFRISWYDDAPHMMSGERWQLRLRLDTSSG